MYFPAESLDVDAAGTFLAWRRTVGEWITERRMAAARALLVRGDLSVNEVGRRSGDRDPAYFARAFSRAHGTTPRRWRDAATRR